ncbi:hypothetical protein E27107_570006 [Elizabethkingia anophelis]|nr:hypothetical protein E18064_540006 [Elizabethkingia anophelis]CDN79425.1 hypothetical protein E27107_570006 [Elizabethkingia anophelis]
MGNVLDIEAIFIARMKSRITNPRHPVLWQRNFLIIALLHSQKMQLLHTEN